LSYRGSCNVEFKRSQFMKCLPNSQYFYFCYSCLLTVSNFLFFPFSLLIILNFSTISATYIQCP